MSQSVIHSLLFLLICFSNNCLQIPEAVKSDSNAALEQIVQRCLETSSTLLTPSQRAEKVKQQRDMIWNASKSFKRRRLEVSSLRHGIQESGIVSTSRELLTPFPDVQEDITDALPDPDSLNSLSAVRAEITKCVTDLNSTLNSQILLNQGLAKVIIKNTMA